MNRDSRNCFSLHFYNFVSSLFHFAKVKISALRGIAYRCSIASRGAAVIYGVGMMSAIAAAIHVEAAAAVGTIASAVSYHRFQ